MPFEKGHVHNQNPKRVQNMLERIVAQDNDQKLRAGLEKVLQLFAEGDRWAIEYVTDRLDGKATQTTNVNITKHISELNEQELLTIASGARDTQSQELEGEFNEVH